MTTHTLDLLKQRRSIYALGRNVSIPNDKLITLIKECLRQSPTPFNNQSVRVVICLGAHHEKIWDTTTKILKDMSKDESKFAATQAKMDGFKAGFGTILFYNDETVVENFRKQFPPYEANFPIWAEQSQGIAQQSVWVALAEQKIGASLQHYNPLIDAKMTEFFEIPPHWTLRAEMVIGSIEAPAGEKSFLPEEQVFKVFQ
ncbi:putative Fatty acid repression mutant protein 2 [Blattamonas nauphoetae]|uniref:Fatty acid repression mutant protein 2 n=1 Tax=Blattamonas nauphoetae TaxID=2049346 RepID=A0ABQ9XVD4_9EUKA|nr:putative Fatty acid repression mutant protein 2 [Blattamonas nauphoetae]